MSKIAVITGATQGLGAAMAVYFAEKGYNIAVNARSKEDVENRGVQVVTQCESHGVTAKCFVADVSDFAACQNMVEEIKDTFGTIDVLINNAGITRDGLLPRMKPEDFTDVITVNLTSVFNMCRCVTPIMMKQRRGSIINMSSVAGVFGNAGQTNYSASKAGIIGLTKSIAKELGGRGIICNAIAPGFIQSPMTDVLPDRVKENILGSISLKRFGEPNDIAQVALFLAETKYVTGQVIIADGGLSM